MRYLACNTNSYNHSDYKKPISVQKSTDYRTTTGTNHRYIPTFPQDYDCRVKVPEKKLKDPVLKNEIYVSDHVRNYKERSCIKDPLAETNPQYCSKVNYFHSLGQQLARNPPHPIRTVESESKEEFTPKFIRTQYRMVYPPNPYQQCEIKAFGRDEQPPFRPEAPGYYKHLDIYLSETRASYVPHSEARQNGIGRKDIITFYDANNVPRGARGYGPREDINAIPLVPRRVALEKKPNKYIPKDHIELPKFTNDTYLSETKDEFRIQTYSDFFPYLFGTGEEFREALMSPTPWQTLIAPAMYCTEYCHYGSGWPVRSVIEQQTPRREVVHPILEAPCTI